MLSPGQLLDGRYRIERLLREGGMGAVYLAEHVGTGRKVAVKVLLDRAHDADTLRRFRQEARASATIGHPGVVEVLDAGEGPEGQPYLAMEFLQGESLAERMARPPILTPAELGWAFDQVLDALGAAHRAGVIHRDLKPDNLFWVHQPRASVKVLDFGLSKLRDGTGVPTVSGVILGTPLYMSPEQVQGSRNVGPATDLYAVGAILYDALAGRPPYPGDSFTEVLVKVVTAPYRPLATLRPDLPPALTDLIDLLLSRDLAVRPADAADVRTRLANALGGQEITAPAMPAAPSASAPAQPAKRSKTWLGLFGLALTVGLAVAGVLASRPHGAGASQAELLPIRVETHSGLTFTKLPGGPFQTGCAPGDGRCGTEAVRHSVELPPFWIAQTHVTVRAYQACINAGACPEAVRTNDRELRADPHCTLALGLSDHPMNCVRFEEAQAFCRWVGGALPSPDQWEYAARSGRDLTYPWGDAPWDATRANGCDRNCQQANPPEQWARLLELHYADPSVDDGWTATSPSGAFPGGATPWGLLDMAGDVQAWVDADFGPPRPGKPQLKEVRGGSYNGELALLHSGRLSGRNPEQPATTVGFRCVIAEPWR